MTADLIEEVRSVRLFKGLPEPSLAALAAVVRHQVFPGHTMIVRQDTVPTQVAAVLSGAVEITAVHREVPSTVSVAGPGNLVGLCAAVRNARSLASLVTLGTTRLLLMPAATLRQMVDSDAALAQAVLLELASTSRSLVRQLHNQKMRTSLERLANWVLAEARQNPGRTSTFPIPYRKKVLAALLGMTTENLSRAFAGLAPHGVSIAGRTIQVSDLEALARFAAPTALIDGPALPRRAAQTGTGVSP